LGKANIDLPPKNKIYRMIGIILLTGSLPVLLSYLSASLFSIVPGHIETPMTENHYATNQKFVNAIWPRLPIRRWGTGDDFGGISVYLMSDASQYHSGAQFVIDGGFVMT
jgi:NAD(P)-dependent dehydrogenase (short-subunit alcohol dehydrogenase family)